MTILAFDACLGAVSVAVRWRTARGEWLVRDCLEARQRGHAERLMPMIAEVMGQAGLAFSDLDRIAVTVGPGSFTGVRVGVAAARGLALATGLAVVGATSLAVMAHRADELLGPRDGQLLAVALDARRGMVYVQVFPDLRYETGGQPLLLAPQEVAPLVASRPVTIVGSGAEAVAGAIASAGGRAEARLVDLQPHARSLALLAVDLPPASPLRPLYLRPPDVKPQADKSLRRAAPP